jgi:Ca2+-transporting ATPase
MVLFDPLMRFLILIIGVSTSALLFVVYLVLLRLGYDPDLVRTFTFAAFGTYTLLVAFSVRSLDKSILSYPLFSNRYLTGSVLIGFVLMASAIYLPMLQTLFGTVSLPIQWVLGVMLIGILNIVLIEGAKQFYKNKALKYN